MKKSFKTNGNVTVTKSNLVKFVEKHPEIYYGDLYKQYLQYLITGDYGRPMRLDHWSADGRFNCYQCGNKWIYVYKDEQDLAYSWIKDEFEFVSAF